MPCFRAGRRVSGRCRQLGATAVCQGQSLGAAKQRLAIYGTRAAAAHPLPLPSAEVAAKQATSARAFPDDRSFSLALVVLNKRGERRKGTHAAQARVSSGRHCAHDTGAALLRALLLSCPPPVPSALRPCLPAPADCRNGTSRRAAPRPLRARWPARAAACTLCGGRPILWTGRRPPGARWASHMAHGVLDCKKC